MDSRIGTLNNGLFYAFVNGYDMPEFVGTREEVERALGVASGASLAADLEATYSVAMRFQFPAWDEVDGIELGEFRAHSKAEAVSMARSAAIRDGHAATGKGRYWFRAVEVE